MAARSQLLDVLTCLRWLLSQPERCAELKQVQGQGLPCGRCCWVAGLTCAS